MQKKLALAKTNTKLQNPGLAVFYNIWPGNAVGSTYNPGSLHRVSVAEDSI